MKMWSMIVSAILASIGSVWLAVRAVDAPAPTAVGPERAMALRKLHDFCDTVKGYTERTARDLESGDPATRKRALNRTYSDRELYSEHEIQLCLGSKPDLGELARCRMDENYPCLARLERRIVKALYVPPLPDR